jgi:hypothetical protein
MRHLFLLLSLVLCTGCVHRYAVISETVVNGAAVGSLSPVYATNIQFAFPQTWESEAEWTGHVSAWNEAYVAALTRAGRDVGERGVQHLPPGAVAPQGLVVTTTVRAILRGNGMDGDRIVADVAFVDAATQGTVLNATVEVTSFRPMGGPEGYTFGGRIKFACLNLADAVAAAVSEGHFPR